MPEASAPPHADPIEAAVAFLDDLRAVLGKLAGLPKLSAADLPDIRAALEAAIYDSPAGDCEDCVNHGAEGLCIQHAARAALIPRWTELLHRLNARTA